MTAREKILRDNGLLAIATAVALATTSAATAARRPAPHNFQRVGPRAFAHPMPHNFLGRHDLS